MELVYLIVPLVNTYLEVALNALHATPNAQVVSDPVRVNAQPALQDSSSKIQPSHASLDALQDSTSIVETVCLAHLIVPPVPEQQPTANLVLKVPS